MKQVSVHKFSPTASDVAPYGEFETLERAKEFLLERYSNPHHSQVRNLHESGCVKCMGWVYYFQPLLKRYVVKQYGTWQEYYAPNKTALRKSLHGKLDKIVEIK